MPQVRDLMVSDVVTIEPSTSVVDAAGQMIQQEKGPLPVVEGGRPVGIVSIGDLAIERDEDSALAEISAAEGND